jgi:predicted RNA binding protein YcfA (HicA-like mRNA interferase family)
LFHESKSATFNKTIRSKGIPFKRITGSHHIFFHPELRKSIVVPVHGKKDIPNGTFLSIIKQAGISKEEI